MLRAYEKYPDAKVAAYGIAVEYPAAAPLPAPGGLTGTMVNFCQLTLPGLPGDYDIPGCLGDTLKPTEAHIDKIVVSGRVRGRGVGTQLLNWADRTCQEAGMTCISLEVMHGNPARRLYERHGYADAGPAKRAPAAVATCAA